MEEEVEREGTEVEEGGKEAPELEDPHELAKFQLSYLPASNSTQFSTLVLLVAENLCIPGS